MQTITNIFKKIISFAKTHKVWAGIIIIVFLVLFVIFQPKAAKKIPTEIVKKSEFIQSISITGTISANKEVNLTFPIQGTIIYLGAQKGDYVQQYQTIATLDQRTVLKNLQNALISYSLQRNDFDQTRENNLNRMPQEALSDKMKRVLEDNQFNLDKAVVSVELQDLARQQAILTSPISGIVTRSDANTPGITAGLTTVFTVTDPNSLSFKMEVDEADVSRVKEGQKVKVVLDTYPNSTLYLVISSIDFVTHTTSTGGNAYDVKAPLGTNDTLKYRVGMNGNAEIILLRKPYGITIPLASLTSDNKVYVKTPTGFTKKTVRLGHQNETQVEIVKGLKVGDIIATDPTLVSATNRWKLFP